MLVHYINRVEHESKVQWYPRPVNRDTFGTIHIQQLSLMGVFQLCPHTDLIGRTTGLYRLLESIYRPLAECNNITVPLVVLVLCTPELLF